MQNIIMIKLSYLPIGKLQVEERLYGPLSEEEKLCSLVDLGRDMAVLLEVFCSGFMLLLPLTAALHGTCIWDKYGKDDNGVFIIWKS